MLVLNHGRLVAKGTPAELRALARGGDIDAALLSP